MSDIILNALLACLAVAVLVSFWTYHHNKQNQFNLLDLITNAEGKIHRAAVMEFGAFVLMTWGFIVLINRDGLTEWYAGIYVGAFVIRGAWSSYLSAHNGNRPPPGANGAAQRPAPTFGNRDAT